MVVMNQIKERQEDLVDKVSRLVEVVAAVVEEAAAAEVVVLVATHQDQELTTDWLWKTCLHVHLGRT